MNYRLIIRRATQSDIPDLVDLLNELFSIEEDFQFDQTKQKAGLLMLVESDPNEKNLIVAELEGEVIGMCSAQTLISTAEGGKAALIEDMVIKSNMRGKGIGRIIMNEIVSWAKISGITRLQLLADKNNSRGISFYEKNEWKTTQLICLRKRKI